MSELLPSIRHNLARLLNFGGRDSNLQFWPWAILIFLVQMVAGFLIMIPMMVGMMMRIFEAGASLPNEAKPDPEIVAARMEKVMAQSLAEFETLWLPSLLLQGAAIAALAAAVARRLHDRGRSGLWGLLPIPFIAIGIANMPIFVAGMTGDRISPLQSVSLALGYGYWIALIVLVLMLVGKGDEGPNRYGPPPETRL